MKRIFSIIISFVKEKINYFHDLTKLQAWAALHCSLIIFDFLEAHIVFREVLPISLRASSFLNRVSTRSAVSRWSLSPRQHGNERKSVCLGQLHGRWTTTCLARWWCESQSIQCSRYSYETYLVKTTLIKRRKLWSNDVDEIESFPIFKNCIN